MKIYTTISNIPESNMCSCINFSSITNINYEKINSFNQIDISKLNSLVICDIDDTLLYWNKKPEDLYYLVDELFPNYDKEKKYKEAMQYLNVYKKIQPPIHTDMDRFANLLNKLDENAGKIIFLTARTKSASESWTKKNFNSLGLDYDKYQVHYTDNLTTKGEYIKNNIQIDKYSEVIFIDDYDTYIKSVLDIFPEIICYKFEIN
jgi:hypothetical protein